MNKKNKWSISEMPALENGTKQLCGGGLIGFTALDIKHGTQADLLLIDDLYSREDQASSTISRNKINNSLKSNAFARIQSTTPIVMISTRYHKDDMIGTLMRDSKEDEQSWQWRYINVPALNDIGESYWPQKWPTPTMHRIRKAQVPKTWAALYMGQPISDGESIFGKCSFYEDGDVPQGCKVSWAIDLAGSEADKADYSTLAKVKYHKQSDTYYVENIWKWKANTKFVADQIKNICGNSQIRWDWGGTENQTLSFLKDMGLKINAKKATKNKFGRAQYVAAIFDKILFNSKIDQEIIEEIETFVGKDSSHDDCVDSFVSAINELIGSSVDYSDIFSIHASVDKSKSSFGLF